MNKDFKELALDFKEFCNSKERCSECPIYSKYKNTMCLEEYEKYIENKEKEGL